jgi:hypothetical protein
MPTFDYVEVWPPTGWPDRPWRDNAEEEAFVKSARSITELYSEALSRLQVPGHRSMLRLTCVPAPTSDVVTVHVSTGRAASFEHAAVYLPTGIAELVPSQRALLALDVVHATVLRLAEARGWDKTRFQAVRQHVLNRALEYKWASGWKSSPDRRHRARACYRLLDDGYGRASIEVQRRDDEATVAVSAEALAFSTSQGFVRSARTLRWDGSSAVQVIPYSGLGLANVHGLVRLERTNGAWGSFADDGMLAGRALATSGVKPAGSRSLRPLVVVRAQAT